MKSMKKTFLTVAVVICAVLALSLTASAETYGDLTYEINNGEVTITSCNKSATSITIPSEIDGYPVTSICDYAFSRCSLLTSIAIPGSVTSIGEWAFYDCSSLTSVNIPDSVTSIDKWAFYDCSSLTSVTIPDSVTSIGSKAFSYCRNLESIMVDVNNPNSQVT